MENINLFGLLVWFSRRVPSVFCFVFFLLPKAKTESNWLIQAHTIAPQIWGKLVLVLVLFSGAGKQRWLFSGQRVTQWNPFLTDLPCQVSTPIQLKNMRTKPNKTSGTYPFHKFLVRGKGVAWPFASGTSDWWFRNLSALFHECCWALGRIYFRV